MINERVKVLIRERDASGIYSLLINDPELIGYLTDYVAETVYNLFGLNDMDDEQEWFFNEAWRRNPSSVRSIRVLRGSHLDDEI